MRNLEYRDYLGIRLPKPPREEQVAIAEAIWKSARALIKAKEMLTAAQRLKTALMQQLFANGIPGSHSVFSPITVFHRKSNMPETWEASRLGESITKIDYGTNAPSNDFRAGYPVLAIPQVVAPRLELGEVPYADLPEPEATALRLQDGDVLLIRTNGNPNYIGKSTLVTSAVASQHVVFASYLIRIRTDKARLSGAYLNYFLASPLGRQQALAMANTSAGNHNLGSRSIKRFVLPRPDIKEQGEIVSILDRGEDVLDKINQEIASLVLLKTSLLQNLLTGKVRVNLEAPYDFHRIQDR
jgi:type I restriction enzyme S subunit